MSIFLFSAFSPVAVAAEGESMRISQPAVQDAIAAVVEAQLAAFRAGDVKGAYGYAAEGLRVQTPLPAFARMVQQNYPEIWQSTRAEFALARDDSTKARLVVHVFGTARDAFYDYVLFKEAGGWRIGGVLRRESRKGDAI